MLLKRSLFIRLTAITLFLSGITLAETVCNGLISEDGIVVGQAILDYIEDEDITVCLVDCWDMESGEDFTVLLFDCYVYGEITDYVELYGFGRIGRAVARIIYVTEGDFTDWSVAVGQFDENGSYDTLAASRMGLRKSKRYMKSLGRS